MVVLMPENVRMSERIVIENVQRCIQSMDEEWHVFYIRNGKQEERQDEENICSIDSASCCQFDLRQLQPKER